MTNDPRKSKKGPAVSGMAGLCILALMAAVIPLAAAQSASEEAAHSYCVKMGYLYRTSPSMNNGQGVCEFPDKTWCDAQAYHAGRCGPSLSSNALTRPYITSSISDQALCSRNGGRLESVHTPYGDVMLCVFADGRACDIQSLRSGRCGGDNWLRYAESWLNAP